jgi:iron complex outermembrane receptor protein
MAIQYSGTLPKPFGVNAFIRGEWYYFGKQYFDLGNQQAQTSYQLLNASVGISYSFFSISVWLRNITDTRYVAYAYDFGAARLGDPYTYGFTMKFRFR